MKNLTYMKKAEFLRLLMAFTAIIIISTACTSSQIIKNMELVDEVNLDRFLGKWYEIARFPHSFEKGLVGVTATYEQMDKGKIKVINQGYKDSLDGELKTAIGKAKLAKSGNPAHLKVSFFWIFYADYLILELGDNYEYALIGSSSDKYLWILSRSPQMDDNTYNMLVQKAKGRGYDIDKLSLVPQKEPQN